MSYNKIRRCVNGYGRRHEFYRKRRNQWRLREESWIDGTKETKTKEGHLNCGEKNTIDRDTERICR